MGDAVEATSGNHRVWYQDRMRGLLEELGEPEEEITRKPKNRQGNRDAKRRSYADAIAVLLNILRDTVLHLARRQLIPSYRWRYNLKRALKQTRSVCLRAF